MKKVGILGGAFDPIHIDHLKMAQIALATEQIDEVWWVPSPDLRWDKSTQYKAEDRCEMISRVIQNQDKMYLNKEEIIAGEYRGAYVFLKKLQKKYSQFEFILIIGGDSYETLAQWRDPKTFDGTNANGEKLKQEFSIIACPRHNAKLLDAKLHNAIYSKQLIVASDELIQRFALDSSSSTQIREDLKKGIYNSMIPPEAVKYLKGLK